MLHLEFVWAELSDEIIWLYYCKVQQAKAEKVKLTCDHFQEMKTEVLSDYWSTSCLVHFSPLGLLKFDYIHGVTLVNRVIIGFKCTFFLWFIIWILHYVPTTQSLIIFHHYIFAPFTFYYSPAPSLG